MHIYAHLFYVWIKWSYTYCGHCIYNPVLRIYTFSALIQNVIMKLKADEKQQVSLQPSHNDLYTILMLC